LTDAATRRSRPAWLTGPVLTVATLSVASGVAQFSVTAVIGDVASAFGEPGDAGDLASQIGLPTTTIGLALALIRLTSLAALPASALGDRYGRRSVVLALSAIGLTLTALAALAPGFWVYVALVALARPMLSAVNGLAGVVAAEESSSRDRSAAIALVTAAYGLGAGVVSLARSALPGEPSFRVVTAFALLPLLLLPLLARSVREPRIASRAEHTRSFPGWVPRAHRRRVLLLSLLAGTIAMATGPGFTYLFVYGEDVLGASTGFTSLLVLGAGPAGLVGLVLGRAGADRVGRRVTAGTMMALTGVAVAAAYSGSTRALAVGYLAAITVSTGFAPPTGALAAELVPTSVRATVAGWVTLAGVLGAVVGLLTFGVLADATGSFATASLTVGVTVVAVAGAFALLPETRGHELDEPDVAAA
jgi:predicted MFS family arabinose efflux permease